MRSALLILLSGCAPAIWNQREIDCSDASGIVYRGERVQLFGDLYPEGGACELSATGLAGSTIEVADEIVFEGVDDVELGYDEASPLPSMSFQWEASGDVQFERPDPVGGPGTSFVLSARAGGEATVSEGALTLACSDCDLQATGSHASVDIRIDHTDRDIILELTAPFQDASIAAPADGQVVQMIVDDTFASIRIEVGDGGTVYLELPGIPVDLLTEGHTYAAFQLDGVWDTDGAEATIEVVAGDAVAVVIVGSSGSYGTTSGTPTPGGA